MAHKPLITGYHKVAKEICDALGLKHVRKLDIHMEMGSMFTIEAEMFMEVDDAVQLPAIFKRFELVEKKPSGLKEST